MTGCSWNEPRDSVAAQLDEILDKNVATIRELLSNKQKDKALLALKKKKMREEQLKGLDNWLLRVEELVNALVHPSPLKQLSCLHDSLETSKSLSSRMQFLKRSEVELTPSNRFKKKQAFLGLLYQSDKVSSGDGGGCGNAE